MERFGEGERVSTAPRHHAPTNTPLSPTCHSTKHATRPNTPRNPTRQPLNPNPGPPIPPTPPHHPQQQARTVAEPIIATVALMAESGLPCFGRGQPLANLRRRFHLELSDAQAAGWMRATINDAYDKWTTGFYDYIQVGWGGVGVWGVMRVRCRLLQSRVRTL